ncbi:hypothetical protein OH687_15445 [Burkholderia anthina]|nr:hypothetical protein OH687_15445 [Burkholderia anthina]
MNSRPWRDRGAWNGHERPVTSARRPACRRRWAALDTPLEAAQRELAEETRREGLALDCVVRFGGLTRLRHVLVAWPTCRRT